ncbi:MAG: FAD-dependent oxidoreductase [Spirochaetia bacterium]
MCADLILLGGGHANLPLIHRIGEIVACGHRVTCVSLAPILYYSGMGPGTLGGAYRPEEIRFPIREMVESGGGTFIEARATHIDAENHRIALEDGTAIVYDVLSANTGSTIAPTVHVDESVVTSRSPKVFRAKPIHQMLELRLHVKEHLASGPLRMVVVGGGPAAVEIAANLCRVVREGRGEGVVGDGMPVQLIAGRQLLPEFPRSAERRVVAALRELGVELRQSERVDRTTAEGIAVSGRNEPADVVVLATGVVPSRIFADSGLPVGEDGSLAVNEYLHTLGHREIFGGGDCVWFMPHPLPRAGVFAVRQGPILVHNVMASLDHGPDALLKRFAPGGAYLLLLNLGDDTALFWRRILGIHVAYRSESAYRLKERIDMAFMHRFGSEADRMLRRAGGSEAA